MSWMEIRKGQVPAAGNEMLAINPDTGEVFDLIIVTPQMEKEWTWADYRNDWFYFFRPLDVPHFPPRAEEE